MDVREALMWGKMAGNQAVRHGLQKRALLPVDRYSKPDSITFWLMEALEALTVHHYALLSTVCWQAGFVAWLAKAGFLPADRCGKHSGTGSVVH